MSNTNTSKQTVRSRFLSGKQANIYNELVRYYHRSRQKLQSLALEGKNLRKQGILKKRIVRLFKTLTGFQRVLKLGMATAALSAGMLLFQPDAAQAQVITFKGPSFGLPDIGYWSVPAFADLDADGDLDMMAGEANGNFFYFQNTGTAANPAYATTVTNPFGLTDIGIGSAPAFADLDADGDLDMMSGEYSGSFFYFQNTGTAANPVFATAVADPFGLTYINIFSSPTFADLDADGDFDLMAGEGDGSFIYFRNTGTAANPVYDAAAINPFGLAALYSSAPAFADLDADGDLDMMAGHVWGSFEYFQNTGTAANPVFAASVTNPFGLIYINIFSSPAFADLDADGDLDMMAGEYYGSFFYFQNTGTAANPAYTELTNPLGLTGIGLNSSPDFADLDADGDFDLMAGEYFGSFYYFQNTGTAADPVYAAAVTNSFGTIDIGKSSTPAFADLDADGDLDMMSGEFNGRFIYFQNTGSAANPVFAASVTNPFGLTDIGSFSSPAFADLDADGDLDMISGANSGGFFYFQNTGTAANPVYAAEVANPFGLTDIVSNSSPAFADLDADGDLDLMSGDQNVSFFYFQNTGTAANPEYATEVTNPFGLTGIGYNSSPALTDLDADGDLDIMSGESAGNFFYFENTTPCNGLTVFADADGDSYGDAGDSIFVADCIVPGGYVIYNTDCDDNNAAIHPGACDADNGNGVDDNCDGNIDNGSGATTYYIDADGDGYGTGIGTSLCSDPGTGYSTNNADCNDAGVSVHPNASEVCNSIDDNCNGQVDEGVKTTFYADADDDTYGNLNSTTQACSKPSGYVSNSTDCNDDPANGGTNIHPSAVEICDNSIDDNCNGVIDENCGGDCAIPTNLTTAKVTSTSAKLKWDEVSGAEGYTVRYKVASTGEWKYGTTYNASKPISGLLPNTLYKWEVKTYCQIAPPYVTSDWSSKQEFTTGLLRLGDESLQQVSFQIYPNPAEDHATIQFGLPQTSHVYIKVYDVSGKEIETLLDGDVEQGEYSVLLNTAHFAKGVYLVKLISPAVLRDGIENQKLIVQ